MIRTVRMKSLEKQGIDSQKLALLDTSSIAFLCLCQENYEKMLKKCPSDYFIRSRWRLARAIVEGELRDGAVTPTVMGELYGISRKSKFEKIVLQRCLEKIKESPKCRLFNIVIPKMQYERFPYLSGVFKEDKGELSITVASLETGIPLIVSDDDDIFRQHGYLEKQYRQRHPGIRRRPFSILRSKDLCDLCGLKY